GWTIEWQGKNGPITRGETLLEAMKAHPSSDSAIVFDRFGHFDDQRTKDGQPIEADVAVVVIAEPPYAEGKGDRVDLTLPKADRELIARVKARARRVIILLYSGRPLIITDELAQADAFVAAFWPGSEAAGLSDLLFGDRPFTGTLSYTWPRSMQQIPLKSAIQSGDPLFPFGFGLTT
ncbi:MAG: glycoside hydrolase family 3 C-terminal domain-containing protein, partial [Anaerolineales bacterium]|nr:glycoside hydrolase family 3 C-terminal domain-containing protein [Anaerolineales bacterium]